MDYLTPLWRAVLNALRTTSAASPTVGLSDLIDMLNVNVQKIYPGPYWIYLDAEDSLKWRVTNDSAEAVLFELKHR